MTTRTRRHRRPQLALASTLLGAALLAAALTLTGGPPRRAAGMPLEQAQAAAMPAAPGALGPARPAAPGPRITPRPIPILPTGQQPPPSLAPGLTVALPALNYLWIDDVCQTRIHAQNAGAAEANAVLVAFGEPGGPCASAPGPIGVTCSGLLAPGSAWIFADADLPAGAKSGLVYAISNGTYKGTPIASAVCAHLQGLVGDDTAFRAFHAAFAAGGNTDIAGIPAKSVRGEPIAVVAHRTCPADLTPGAQASAAYEGLSEAMTAVPITKGGADYRYQVPLVEVDRHGYHTSLSLQNASAECASVELVFRAQDGCTETPWCAPGPLEIAPGEALALDPLDCLPPGWLGSVEVSSDAPLAIVGDIVGRDALVSFRGVADGAGSGSTELYGPLAYSAQQGWDTQVQVQNLGEETAQAGILVYDGQGAIESMTIQTICPKGTVSVLVPVLHDQPGTDTGWIRVESHPHAGAPAQPLEALARLSKYSDAARTELREASAYNLLHVRDLASDRMALPMVYQDLQATGLTSEIQLGLSLAPNGGWAPLAHSVFTAAGPTGEAWPLSLETAHTAYQVLGTGAVPAPGLQGSLRIEDSGSRGRAGAVGLVRRNTLVGQDIPGDEAAAYLAVPID